MSEIQRCLVKIPPKANVNTVFKLEEQVSFLALCVVFSTIENRSQGTVFLRVFATVLWVSQKGNAQVINTSLSLSTPNRGEGIIRTDHWVFLQWV